MALNEELQAVYNELKDRLQSAEYELKERCDTVWLVEYGDYGVDEEVLDIQQHYDQHTDAYWNELDARFDQATSV